MSDDNRISKLIDKKTLISTDIMSKKWILWEGLDLNQNKQKDFLSSKKFKLLILFF